jgi:hypothetical protein
VIYKVLFETNIGPILFIWRAQEYVEIFFAGEETPLIINPFDYVLRLFPFRRDLDSFADFCRWHIWEMERGVQIISVKSEAVSRINLSNQGNESPS